MKRPKKKKASGFSYNFNGVMENEIKLYFHCKKCCEENKERFQNMREYSSIECGWTEAGFQVWCKRHNCNVVNVGFKGQKVELKG